MDSQKLLNESTEQKPLQSHRCAVGLKMNSRALLAPQVCSEFKNIHILNFLSEKYTNYTILGSSIPERRDEGLFAQVTLN